MDTEKVTGDLTNWPVFCANVPQDGTALFGFKLPIGDVNRFRARYRVAKCFRGIELEDYGEATTAGYSALSPRWCSAALHPGCLQRCARHFPR